MLPDVVFATLRLPRLSGGIRPGVIICTKRFPKNLNQPFGTKFEPLSFTLNARGNLDLVYVDIPLSCKKAAARFSSGNFHRELMSTG